MPSAENLSSTNDHLITLEQALTTPQEISLIFRTVVDGHIQDQTLKVWLVGQEAAADVSELGRSGRRFHRRYNSAIISARIREI